MRTEYTLVEFTFAYYPKGTKVLKGELDDALHWRSYPEDILDAVKLDAVLEIPEESAAKINDAWRIASTKFDSEFSEDGICVVDYKIVSDTDGHYGSNLEGEIDNSSLFDVMDSNEVFKLAEERWARINTPAKPERKPHETFGEIRQNEEWVASVLKEVPVILRVLTLWAYRTWHDSYTGDYDCECELDRVVTMGEIVSSLRKPNA